VQWQITGGYKHCAVTSQQQIQALCSYITAIDTSTMQLHHSNRYKHYADSYITATDTSTMQAGYITAIDTSTMQAVTSQQ
jgi:superoxide dismutase